MVDQTRNSRHRERKPLAMRLIGWFFISVARIMATPFLAVRHLLRARVPARTILELDLEEGVVERHPDDLFTAVRTRKRAVLRDVVEALHAAERDKRVVALVARIGSEHIGMAQAEEIREAVQSFRESGKPAFAFAETLGEGSPGHVGYYLACAFDEIYLQPSGDIGLTGLSAESPFFKRLLEKAGVEPRLDNRHEYKNAKNLFTEERFTGPHRESLEGMLQSLFRQLVAGIAEGRRMTAEQVEALVSRGPFVGREALESRLVDGLAYRDEVFDRLRERFENARFLYHSAYLERADRPFRHGPTIALVHGVGVIRRGGSARTAASELLGGVMMDVEEVARGFRAAIRDERVRAIVFRVDSRGGSYVASDTIWRETVRARAAGKPVIVSMGNVAGSGGYFIAMDAEKIVAQPSTITGSIGVVSGKAVTRRFWEKIGVTWDAVEVGGGTTMWSPVRDYSDEDWERLQATLDRVYADFTSKVAEGRHLTPEQVDEAARGRIWSGSEALRLGLVDELGGLQTALRLAREAAGIAPEAQIRLQEFPGKRSLVERLRRARAASSEDVPAEVAGSLAVSMLPLIELGRRAGLFGEIGELEMPEIPELWLCSPQRHGGPELH